MSKPMFLFPSWCAEYILEMSSLPFTPEFSASARGRASKASANFLMAYCSRPGQDYREERKKTIERSCFYNLSAGDAGKTKRAKQRGEARMWTLYTSGNRLKSAYLSIWGELFGQFNLSGSGSRYQSFVLKTVRNTETVAAVEAK